MKEDKNLELYELEKVRFFIKDACGLDVAYAYDNLVFAEHGLFIVQFLEKSGIELACWFNLEINEENEIRMFDSLAKTVTLNGSYISYKGKFEMNQKANSEEIDIKFIPF